MKKPLAVLGRLSIALYANTLIVYILDKSEIRANSLYCIRDIRSDSDRLLILLACFY